MKGILTEPERKKILTKEDIAYRMDPVVLNLDTTIEDVRHMVEVCKTYNCGTCFCWPCYYEDLVKLLEEAGFEILQADEVMRPIRFYDVGAFVWFARVIVWEFPDFSVDRCFENLLKLQNIISEKGFIEGTIHRYMIVAGKM